MILSRCSGVRVGDKSIEPLRRMTGVPGKAPLRCLLTISTFTLIAACGDAPYEERPTVDTTDARSKPLLVLAEEVPRLDRFRRAVEVTGFHEVLEGMGPFTVFAPLNEGFLRTVRLDTVFAEGLRDSLSTIVGLHVVRGTVERIWADSLVVSTVAQHPVTLRKTDRGLLIQNKPVVGRFTARNGVLYVIPSALTLPPPDTTRGLLEEREVRAET